MTEIEFLEIALWALAVLVVCLTLLMAWLAWMVAGMRAVLRRLSALNPEVPRDMNGRRFKERY